MLASSPTGLHTQVIKTLHIHSNMDVSVPVALGTVVGADGASCFRLSGPSADCFELKPRETRTITVVALTGTEVVDVSIRGELVIAVTSAEECNTVRVPVSLMVAKPDFAIEYNGSRCRRGYV